MRIACGITLYNPEKEDLDNILFYAGCFEKVYIYNNTVESNIIDYVMSRIRDYDNIMVISSGNNDGLSIACNELCKYSKKEGFEYIILFDQDTRMDEENIGILLNELKLISSNKKIAMYCPKMVNFDGNEDQKKDKEFVEWCITSGSVIDLSIFENPFVFDDNYFIDRVDRDYCKQVRDAGYKICKINSAVLYQQLGEERVVFGRKVSTHSRIRHYYIMRNRLYYNYKFYKKIEATILSFVQSIRHIVLILFCESEKTKKIGMCVKGIKDYMNKNMGKYKGVC